jgi:hypothetical protein
MNIATIGSTMDAIDFSRFSAPRPALPAAGADAGVQETRSAMRQFVGETFFGLLVQQFQKGLDRHNPLWGGRGEEVFRGELNQVMVRRMAATKNFPLADTAVEQLLKNTPHSRVVSPERAGAAYQRTKE